MKTLDEVIEALNNCADVNANFEACECCEYRDIRDDGYDCGRLQMMEDALYYLKEYQTEQKKKPLTLDELKQMTNGYVMVEGQTAREKTGRKAGKVYSRFLGVTERIAIFEKRCCYMLEDYGKTWQAYRKERS